VTHLYHYFEKAKGPFLSLTALSNEDAVKIQDSLRSAQKTFAAQRSESYLPRRRELERLARGLFMQKGGAPERETPHYFVVGECPWLATWYERADRIQIPIDEFDMRTVSFTYGDTFPTFSPSAADGMEYRSTVYTHDEIIGIIERYGMPQDKWDEPAFGKPAYVEAQAWSDEPALRYRKAWEAGALSY